MTLLPTTSDHSFPENNLNTSKINIRTARSLDCKYLKLDQNHENPDYRDPDFLDFRYFYPKIIFKYI